MSGSEELNYITISAFTSVRSMALAYVLSCPIPLPIHAVVSQNFTNESCLICVKSRVKNMHPWSTSDPYDPRDEEKPNYIHYNIRGGKAKPSILKLDSVFHRHLSVGPKQLFIFFCISTPRCSRTMGMS